ncbi:MAG: hypothetical protein HKP12_10285 [Gammaproteobacteria bacterium]|nr:hypothetical protein [Gammaproteobacteria bacterium]
MTLAASPNYADDDDHKGREEKDDGEYVAITLKTDPRHDSEAACVALQLGMNLLSPIVPDATNTLTSVEPAEKVVLFPTLGGVELVNTDTDLNALICQVPGESGLKDAPLAKVLEGFIMAGGEVIVCPLCAYSRFIYDYELPHYASMGNGESIHELFIDADKVLSF